MCYNRVMKKKMTLAAVLAAALVLTACGNQTVSFSGAYWNKDYTVSAIVPIGETLEYSVASITKDSILTDEIKSETLSLEVGDTSTFTTELSVTESGTYLYKTTLTISGKYVFNGGEYEFEDDVTYTETEFKGLNENLVPVRSYRRAENVVPKTDNPSGAESFKKMSYTATVVYDGTTATAEVVPDEDSKEGFIYNEKPVTLKNYLKNTFLDEDIMLFAFRAMKFDSANSYSFDTVDKLGQAISKLSVVPKKVNTKDNSFETTPITLSNYRHNGSIMEGNHFDTYLVAFKTTGKYAKEFKYVCYATNRKDEYGNEVNDTKHVPVKIYQPQLYRTGYLCFTLKSITD